MRSERFNYLILLTFAIALGLPSLPGCGSQDDVNVPSARQASSAEDDPGDGAIPPGPEDEPQLTLAEPQPETITAGSTGSTITATLVGGDGNPLENRTVEFGAAPASVGQLSATSALTDGNGQAAVVVTGLRAGQVGVTARFANTSADPVTVIVLPPRIAISASPATISASSPGTGGAVITATITDAQGGGIAGLTVEFATTLGQLTSVTSPAAGQYDVTLTSTEAGTAFVSASAVGITSDSVEVTVAAGALATLALTPSPNQIPPNGQAISTISVTGEDEFQNPVGTTVDLRSTTVDLATPLGQLSESSVDLVAGQGQVEFTSTEVGIARITASVGGADVAFADVSVVEQLEGEPSSIQFEVLPPEITVMGSGGTEVSNVTITVIDVNEAPIDDVANNLELKIVTGPGGGETLNGSKGLGQVLTLSTVQGQAVATVHAGVRPGTIQIEVGVTKDKSGKLLAEPLTAVLPQIAVRSGPPASLFLTRANAVVSPGLAGFGSITHDHLAFVTDLWGNAVPDGTIVFFSQFLDFIVECRTRREFDPVQDPLDGVIDGDFLETCADGSFQPSADPENDPRATFTTETLSFDGVNPGDTLVIITETNPNGWGGYRINEVVNSTTLQLDVDVTAADSNLEWAIGNNASLGGGVFTTEGAAATAGGVARWSNTYAGELINRPVYVFAESEGGTQGHGRFFHLSGLAPIAFVQTAGPENDDKVKGGTQFVFSFVIQDASAPTPYFFADLDVAVGAQDGVLDIIPETKSFKYNDFALGVETTSAAIATNDPGGALGFLWTAPVTVVSEGIEVDISVGAELSRTKLTLKVQP